MGKHDDRGHQLHISKNMKFKQPRPSLPMSPKTLHAPQEPKPGTTAHNQFR
jgi:hypothetical protein